MTKIEQIDEAINLAEQGKSKLTDEVIDSIGGYTSPKIRHLLNNLGAISHRYFEVGVHRGATFVAANYKNNMMAIAVDNWSEFNEDNSIEKEFVHNAGKYIESNYTCISQDCFKLSFEKPEIDFYLYDGNHSYESQKKAFTHFYKGLENECIVCIDDADWHDVKQGTEDGILACNFKILYHRHLKGADGWHNGFAVYFLKKNDKNV